MGYACPVCGDPQADETHLANHLAFTALTRGGDHEDWLDERVPEWGDLGESQLGDLVADHADRTEYPQVFEDTTGTGNGESHGHGHDQSHGHDSGHGRDHDGGGRAEAASQLPFAVDDRVRGAVGDEGELDRATREAIAEARRLTGSGETGDGADEADAESEANDAASAATDSETE
jgi:hypothetical protein